jgi:hypothetical protein
MIRSFGCSWSWAQPWATDTPDHRGPGPVGGARVGGVGSILDRGSRRPVGDVRLPAAPRPGRRDHRYTSGRAGASRAAVWRWPAGRMTDPVGALRDAHLALPDPCTSTSRHAQADSPVVTAGSRNSDHRIVAQAPDRNGLVGNSRAPASGTATRATTVFGSSPNATRSPTERVDADGSDSPRRRDRRGGGIPVPGCRGRRAQAERFVTRSTPRLFDPLARGTVTSISSVGTLLGSRSAERHSAGPRTCLSPRRDRDVRGLDTRPPADLRDPWPPRSTPTPSSRAGAAGDAASNTTQRPATTVADQQHDHDPRLYY